MSDDIMYTMSNAIGYYFVMYVSDRRQSPSQSGRTLKHHFSEDSWMEMFWFRQSMYGPQANTWTCPRSRSPTGTPSSPQGASSTIATVSATPTQWTGRDRLCLESTRLYWNTIVYTCMIVHFSVNRHSLIILVACIIIILYFSPLPHCHHIVHHMPSQHLLSPTSLCMIACSSCHFFHMIVMLILCRQNIGKTSQLASVCKIFDMPEIPHFSYFLWYCYQL